MDFEVDWEEFCRCVDRGREHTDPMQREKFVHYRETGKAIFFYYDFLGTTYMTKLMKDSVKEEDMKVFVEKYLKPALSIQVLSEI